MYITRLRLIRFSDVEILVSERPIQDETHGSSRRHTTPAPVESATRPVVYTMIGMRTVFTTNSLHASKTKPFSVPLFFKFNIVCFDLLVQMASFKTKGLGGLGDIVIVLRQLFYDKDILKMIPGLLEARMAQ